MRAGAAGIFISEQKRAVLDSVPSSLLSGKLVAAVPNVLNALTKLAAVWRSQFDYPVVAITGSVGKTSTKQLVENIFPECYIILGLTMKNQISKIQDRGEMLKITRALNNARSLYNLIRLSGNYELL